MSMYTLIFAMESSINFHVKTSQIKSVLHKAFAPGVWEVVTLGVCGGGRGGAEGGRRGIAN